MKKKAKAVLRVNILPLDMHLRTENIKFHKPSFDG